MTPPGGMTAAAKKRPGRRASGAKRTADTRAPGRAAARTGARGPRAGARRTTARGPGTRVATRPGSAARVRQRPASRRSLQRSSPIARRLSGPSSRAIPELRPLPVLGAVGLGALRAGRSLHDSPLLDRLLRGRGWIGLLGVLLIGLVAINVSLLKLNSEAGRDADTAKTLRIRNDRLRAQVARLASGERLEAVGAKLGLKMPEPGRIRYLSVRSRDGRRAAKAIRSGQLSGPAATTPSPPAPAPAETPMPAAAAAPAEETAPAGPPVGGVPPAAPEATTPAPEHAPQQAPPATDPDAAGGAPAAAVPAE